ncbi:hypothetical protein BLNAU_22716 [Blattamonas nauphoetae]|uniref:Uncharacterized protein n=1 Tax=Blattamonas nauphoetae TaxID=2049346 RepID=A0ABQ9WSR5_9EUKA|nr:hypothetical protein BLNAU_22716 [Blattamonas nauphoetae]
MWVGLPRRFGRVAGGLVSDDAGHRRSRRPSNSQIPIILRPSQLYPFRESQRARVNFDRRMFWEIDEWSGVSFKSKISHKLCCPGEARNCSECSLVVD